MITEVLMRVTVDTDGGIDEDIVREAVIRAVRGSEVSREIEEVVEKAGRGCSFAFVEVEEITND